MGHELIPPIIKTDRMSTRVDGDLVFPIGYPTKGNLEVKAPFHFEITKLQFTLIRMKTSYWMDTLRNLKDVILIYFPTN